MGQQSQLMPRDKWFYPQEIANDLKIIGLPDDIIQEVLACAWEYARCIIPHFTNWPRYLAFIRLVVVATLAEFQGSLVDVIASDRILGYDIGSLLNTLYAGNPALAEMAREFRAFLLITSYKSSERRSSGLFHRYVEALAQSPENWFRLRDCDALLRFSIAAALACNDFDNTWFNEEELQILAELGNTLYDATAFYKHRAEGEICNTFAYVGDELRVGSYHECREILWSLDVKWAKSPPHRCVINLLRSFGGPIHMMMRRYRFVEEGLTIGNPETEDLVTKAQNKEKLWNRLDSTQGPGKIIRYNDILGQSTRLLFPGLKDMLQANIDDHCNECTYSTCYGTTAVGHFGGVHLCKDCRCNWQKYVRSFSRRVSQVILGQP